MRIAAAALAGSMALMADVSGASASAKKKQKHINQDAPIASQKQDTEYLSVEPFDDGVERLPQRFGGVDRVKVAAILSSASLTLKKGEYETVAEHKKRTEVQAGAALSPMSINALYAFKPYGATFQYDADAQEFVGKGFTCHITYPDVSLKEWASCGVGDLNVIKSTYVGSNSFGASSLVYKYRGERLAVGIQLEKNPAMSVFKKSFRWLDYEDRFGVPVDKAKTVESKDISVLFVGKVISTDMFNGHSLVKEATISNPEDVLITEKTIKIDLHEAVYYVYSTGEILHKKKFKQHEQQIDLLRPL